MVRLIHLKIPQAVTACLNLAAKIELDICKEEKRIMQNPASHLETLKGFRDHYVQLAEDIEGLRYITMSAVDSLVAANSFLKEFVQ